MTAPITAPIKVLDLDGWRRSVWEWDAQIRHLLRATAGPLRSTRSGADLRSGGKLNRESRRPGAIVGLSALHSAHLASLRRVFGFTGRTPPGGEVVAGGQGGRVVGSQHP